MRAGVGATTVFAVLMLAGLSTRAAEELSKLTPKQILDRVDDLYRGESAEGEMTMKVVTEHWTREMRMEFFTKGKDKSLFRILAPKKEKGTSTLKNGQNIWNYLPKVKRTIKLPSSMMGGAWMGSHFTNDDLVKESRMADDFDFQIAFEGQRDGVEVVEIECIPKPDAAVVWGKIVVRVRRADVQPLLMSYFDEDLELARSMSFSDFKVADDRTIPWTMRVVPTDKPDEYTEVRYNRVRFNVELNDKLFSIRNLEK